MDRYRVFDHTADLGVEIFGHTLEDMFVNAAYAVFDLMTDLHLVRSGTEKIIVVDGEGIEDLLVNYLREILYLFNGEGFLPKQCSVAISDPSHLQANLSGEAFDRDRHPIHMEIKAVTYHQISVTKTTDGWVARVILDV